MSSQVNNAAFYILDLFFFCGFLLGTGLAPHCTAVLRGRDSGWVAGRLCSTGMDGQGLAEEVLSVLSNRVLSKQTQQDPRWEKQIPADKP